LIEGFIVVTQQRQNGEENLSRFGQSMEKFGKMIFLLEISLKADR
jgi:hypothetical protein